MCFSGSDDRPSSRRSVAAMLKLNGTLTHGLPDSAFGPTLVGGLTALVLSASVVVWASNMSVASAAAATGRVTVEGNRRALQHRDGGAIASVFVKEGQLVRQGQKLL